MPLCGGPSIEAFQSGAFGEEQQLILSWEKKSFIECLKLYVDPGEGARDISSFRSSGAVRAPGNLTQLSFCVPESWGLDGGG